MTTERDADAAETRDAITRDRVWSQGYAAGRAAALRAQGDSASTLDVSRLAAAINDAQMKPGELALGHDLMVPARRIAKAYDDATRALCACNPELVAKGYHRVECSLSGRVAQVPLPPVHVNEGGGERDAMTWSQGHTVGYLEGHAAGRGEGAADALKAVRRDVETVYENSAGRVIDNQSRVHRRVVLDIIDRVAASSENPAVDGVSR